MFYLRTIDEYCNQTENLKTHEQWFQYNKEYPYQDVIDINVSMCYDKQTKKFYNYVFGMIGNMGGDFFWDSEYVLKVLRANDVPEDDIPNFIKNYMDIEKRYLEGENILCEKHPRYVHKKRTVESEESMDIDDNNIRLPAQKIDF
jgi:hypothetical protein